MPCKCLGMALAASLLASFSHGAAGADAGTDLHWYGGGMAGMSRINLDESFWNPNPSFTSTNMVVEDLSYQVFVGYQFNRYLSAEVAYLKLGRTELQAVSTEPIGTADDVWLPGKVDGRTRVIGFTEQAVAMWPLTSQWGVYARGGLFTWSTTAIYHYPINLDANTRINSDGVSLVGGAGVQKSLGRRWYLRAEWQYTTAQVGLKQEIEASFASVGLIHYFH